MTKEIQVAFISIKLKQSFEKLQNGKFEDKKLYVLILRALEDLKNNPETGLKIPKKLWPSKYSVTNLWKLNLPNSWRLIYTIESDDVKILSIILEWFDHKGYERRFGY